jgi:N-methylhydantoinase A/oxoprolinase/acetone carboxylase beta subunit
MRIGIDVGGTNTDAVLVSGTDVVAKIKTPTTADVMSGIVTAIEYLLGTGEIGRSGVTGVMIGTTHFTNAIVECRRLARTGVLRFGLPATQSVEPFEDWPERLRESIGAPAFILHGGNEFDGREISPLNDAEVVDAVRELVAQGIEAVAVSSVFSPVTPDLERRAAAIIEREAPELTVTLSHEIGRLGLLERENAAAINAALRPLAAATVESFRQSLAELNVRAPLYLTQNDGTIMHADIAERYPVLTFASGPTNSMRGAAFLSGLENALVLDIGGTTSDVGALVSGFPRESAVAATFADVRTNFRMPDLFSFGLGGGSIVRLDGYEVTVGPDSVGYELLERAQVFGGDVLTATDAAVAAGMADLGDRANVDLSPEMTAATTRLMQTLVEDALDRMKLNKSPEPVVVVGGGSILIGDEIAGAARVVRPADFEVANAVGAAIAQVSGEVDKIFSLAGIKREDAMRLAREEAIQAAVKSGSARESTRLVEIEEIPVTYMESSMIRVRAKAVGDLASERTVAPR